MKKFTRHKEEIEIELANGETTKITLLNLSPGELEKYWTCLWNNAERFQTLKTKAAKRDLTQSETAELTACQFNFSGWQVLTGCKDVSWVTQISPDVLEQIESYAEDMNPALKVAKKKMRELMVQANKAIIRQMEVQTQKPSGLQKLLNPLQSGMERLRTRFGKIGG